MSDEFATQLFWSLLIIVTFLVVLIVPAWLIERNNKF